MVTLDLSRVDRKTQGLLELVSYWSLLVWLHVPLNRSKKFKKIQTQPSDLFNDRKWFSIDRKSWNSNFQNFSKAVFFVFHEQTFNIWTLQTEIDVKTKFYWCYNLKIQFNILKFKFKQHHNINFSFHQIIVSTTCRKLKNIIF